MSASAEAENVGETVHLSVRESAVDVTGHSVHSGQVADPYADANRKRNPVRHRVFKTVCLYVSFETLGMCVPLVGTTLVHMQRLFDSDTATISWTFTVSSLGYLLGAVACGFIFDRFNHELLLLVASCIEAATTIIAPFFTSLPLFIAALFIQANSEGFIDASGQSYCVGLWTGHRYKEPVLQAAHAMWSLGATIGPFIIGRFLVELPPRNNTTSVVNCTKTSSSASEAADIMPTAVTYNYGRSADMVSCSAVNTTIKLVGNSEVAVVRYAYVMIGAIVFVASVFYAVAYGLDYCAKHAQDQQMPSIQQTIHNANREGDTDIGDKEPAEPQHREKLLRFIFLALLFLYYKIYAFIELIPIDYFPTFAIKFLHWPVKDASLLMSLFFGTNCLGRFLGVLLSVMLRPRTMLIANLLLTMIAYVILFSVKNLPELLWASAALAGIGMATTFATTILWVAESVAISGRVASIVVASGSFGSIIQPQIVGRLFDVPAVGGPMSMVYVLVTAALAHIALFTCMLIFVSRCFSDRRSAGLQEPINAPISVVE